MKFPQQVVISEYYQSISKRFPYNLMFTIVGNYIHRTNLTSYKLNLLLDYTRALDEIDSLGAPITLYQTVTCYMVCFMLIWNSSSLYDYFIYYYFLKGKLLMYLKGILVYLSVSLCLIHSTTGSNLIRYSQIDRLIHGESLCV